MQLKHRQQEAHDAIFSAMSRGVDKSLVCLPTGVGKTVLACHVANSFDRVLFLAHRQELVEQTAETIAKVAPSRELGFFMQGQHQESSFTIGMIQSVHRRLGKIDPGAFDAIIVDECHHAMAKSWRAVCEHFTPRLRLGLSATPERMDGSDLSCLFSEIVYQMSLLEAISEGYLVRPVAHQCLTSCSLAGVKTQAGDLNERELAAAIDVPERNAFIVEKYQQYASGRRAIAFAVTVNHARNIAESFNAAGIAADYVSGDSPDRADKLARFAAGEIRVLASCMVLCEGFDDPGVDCVLLCRPTASRVLFAQMIGRGLRLNPGKDDCIVLDFTDNAGRHRLASAWRFLGHDVAPKDERPREISDGTGKRESTVISMDLERSIDLLMPAPDMPEFVGNWTFEPATEKQLVFLSALGYPVKDVDYSKGGAAHLISNHPASTAQLNRLARLGYDVSGDWTYWQFKQALEQSRVIMQSALVKMRSAGFRVEASGKVVNVHPDDRLSPVQRHWIEKNRDGLLLALAA